jgi:C4-dicarboxylate-specific signal transduction histidine kinase
MSTSENREAAFIARITASTTHEVRNVLAIVKESAGLIEDMVRALDGKRPLDREKLARAVGRIDAQVGRGAEILTNLNRLAHCLDHPQDRVDLNQEVQRVAFLCQRFARQGRHSVEVRPGDQELPVVLNALHLQMALFTAVECCLDLLPEPGTVTIHACRQGDRPSVEFVGEARETVVAVPPTGAAGWGKLAELLDSLGASLEATDTACRFSIMLPDGGAA